MAVGAIGPSVSGRVLREGMWCPPPAPAHSQGGEVAVEVWVRHFLGERGSGEGTREHEVAADQDAKVR